MDNPETLPILGTQDTGVKIWEKSTTQHRKLKKMNEQRQKPG
jgi:hypothetical protein